MTRALLCIMALCLLGGCAIDDPVLSPHEITEFHRGNYQSVMTGLEPALARKKSASHTLSMLRYGSSALYSGQYDIAKETFISISEVLENFQPDGEFKAIVTRESSKDFLGDPYEQMMAFFYLGLLDYRDNRFDMALPGFKTALLADCGSREERYQADSGAVLYMMGRTYQRQGHDKEAQQYFKDARNLVLYKVVLDKTSQAVKKAAAASRGSGGEVVRLAEEIYLRELSRSAWIDLDAKVTLKQAAESSETTIQYFIANPGKSQDPKTWKKVKEKREEVVQAIFNLEKLATELLDSIPPRPQEEQYNAYAAALDQMTSPGHNVLLYLELGKGPYKYRSGDHGSILNYGRGSYLERLCRATVDDNTPMESIKLDDLYYQASTRGGRAMDDFLKGKAFFKDVTAAAAVAAVVTSAVLYNDDQSQAGTIALAAGAALGLMSLATTPQADIRHWEFLPGQIHAISCKLPPGAHQLKLEFLDSSKAVISRFSRTVTIEVKPDIDNVFIFRAVDNSGFARK